MHEPAVFEIMFIQGWLGVIVTLIGVVIYIIADACNSSMPAINAFVYTRSLFDSAGNFFLTIAVILGWGAFMALNFVLIGGTSGMQVLVYYDTAQLLIILTMMSNVGTWFGFIFMFLGILLYYIYCLDKKKNPCSNDFQRAESSSPRN